MAAYIIKEIIITKLRLLAALVTRMIVSAAAALRGTLAALYRTEGVKLLEEVRVAKSAYGLRRVLTSG